MDLPAIKTPQELRDFISSRLQVTVPDFRACPGHQTPWDYICDGFFKQWDCLVWANRGGGKTMLAALLTVLQAAFHEKTDIIILGGSMDQSDRVADYVRDLLACTPEWFDDSSSRRRIKFVNGSSIVMLPQSEKAIRGMHVQKIRCDEVELFDAGVWTAVHFSTASRKLRGGSDSLRSSLDVLSTAHVPGGLMESLIARARSGQYAGKLYTWCLWEVIEKCQPQRQCGDCPLHEDCRGVAREASGFFGIDDAIAIKARASRAAWQAEMLCQGAHRDWLVLGEFEQSRHVREVDYNPDWPLYRAIDFGYTCPFVCLWIQVTPLGVVHVIQEYVRTRTGIAVHAKNIRELDPGPAALSYVDPAGRQKESTSGKACTEILNDAGITCAWRTSNIVDGLELIRCALAPADNSNGPKIAIHPRCVKLIEAFNNYHYPPPGSPADSDTPVKDGPDHLIDALRYFFVNRMRPRTKTIRGSY